MVKILLAQFRASDFTVRIGGDENSLDQLAQKLHQKGVDVTVLYPKLSVKREYKIVNYANKNFSDRNFLYFSRRYIKTINKISKDFDIILCNYTTPSFALLNWFIPKEKRQIVRFGTPIMENLLKDSGVYVKESLLRYILRLLTNNKILARLAPKNSRLYLVSTDYQKKQLQKLGVKNVKVLPNCIDPEKYAFESNAREVFGFKKDKKIITYIGHLWYNKGVYHLIEAFRRLNKKHPNTRLVLATGTKLNKEVVRLVEKYGLKDKVSLIGKTDIGKLLSASDIVALPYLLNVGTHMFPSSILETYSIGVPLVSTDLPIIKEIVEDGKTGLLVKPKNPTAIESAITRYLKDEELCKKVIKNQREKIKDYTSDVIADKYIELFKELKNGKHS